MDKVRGGAGCAGVFSQTFHHGLLRGNGRDNDDLIITSAKLECGSFEQIIECEMKYAEV